MSFHCNICNVGTNSEAMLNQHYAGSKHKRRAANPQNSIENKAERIKASGMNYFVKAAGAPQDENQQTSTGAEKATFNSSTIQWGSFEFCSTCRISLTSASQAQMHYSGSKHRHKLQLIEDVKVKDKGDDDSSDSKLPLHYCETCQIRMTSVSQLEIHFNGHKHKQKCRLLQGAEGGSVGNDSQNLTSQKTPFVDLSKVDTTFCDVCHTNFTSPSQAQMHYQGSKHRNALQVREEKRSMTSNIASSQDDGEPAAKKAKFVEICETCNVKMLCPETASTHYNGIKHAKKILHLKELRSGQEKDPNQKTDQHNTSHQMVLHPHPGSKRNQMSRFQQPSAPSPNGATGMKKGGHFYCSFCDISVNSQTQMDAHRSGSKHMAHVEQIAQPGSKAAASPFMDVRHQQTVTNVYSMMRSHRPFQNPQLPPPPPPMGNNMISQPSMHAFRQRNMEAHNDYVYHEMY